MTDELQHYGTPRHSGRYPWGSGADAYQSHKDFRAQVDEMKKQKLSDTEIAKGLGMTTTEFRARMSVAKNEVRKYEAFQASELKKKNMSTTAIAERMGKSESSIRALLNPVLAERSTRLATTIDMLKSEVDEKGYIDVGRGVNQSLDVTGQRLNTAIAALKQEGYKVYYHDTKQLGTGKFTTVKVLGSPDSSFSEIAKDPTKIKMIGAYVERFSDTPHKIQPPVSVDSKRIAIRYGEDGGSDKEGVIELRRGVPDISLGDARYAQVRIAVDGSHYLKGMAVYSDDIPAGHDIVFNTTKTRADLGSDKLAAMKKMKGDPEEPNPFGATIRQKEYTDKSGKKQLSALNIVGSKEGSGEEGGWGKWSKTLSSQFLSKQTPELAKTQLGIGLDIKKVQFEEIMGLTNPVVRANLLRKFADEADSSAVHLEAAALPRTAAHVLLPMPSMKPNEIYAPNYNNGDRVVLVRHPHGGTFELPELTVNNRNRVARALLPGVQDAVGIHPKVAAQLSGADFDGDTVLVIPQSVRGVRKIQVSAPLKELADFNPRELYKQHDGMKVMTSRNTQAEMGKISNLITDMTIKKAPQSEIARAVKHSMVVIDAEKHKLDYEQSFKDNGIADLKKKYQGEGTRANAGASTIISRAKSEIRIPDRKARPASEGGPVNKETGQLEFVPTGASYVRRTTNPRTGVVTEKTIQRTITTTRMAEAKDARSLVSSNGGTLMEKVYADHANALKALANQARKEAINTKNPLYSPSAKAAYAKEVASLNSKLNVAQKNAPLERQAQILANAIAQAKRQSNPDLTKDQIKKLEQRALIETRARLNAKKEQVQITDSEWAAIQAGAITASKLSAILDNADPKRVKELATPRENPVMKKALLSRAKNMAANGYDNAEIAAALGVNVSTLKASLGKEG